MKKIMLALIVISCLGACKKKEVVQGCMDPNSLTYNAEATIDNGLCIVPTQKQNVLVMGYTTTNCSSCGNTASTIDNLIDYKEDVFTIALHESPDPMHWSPCVNNSWCSPARCLVGQFKLQRPGIGRPDFYIGDYNSSSKQKIQEYRQQIVTAASVGIAKFSEGKIYLNVLTAFFRNANGNYYVGAYLIENGIAGGNGSGSYNQDGAPGNYKHDYVLRESFSSLASENPNIPLKGAFGEPIAESTISNGNTYSNTFQLPLNTKWNIANCHILVVVWEKDDTGFYKFVNVNKVEIY